VAKDLLLFNITNDLCSMHTVSGQKTRN